MDDPSDSLVVEDPQWAPGPPLFTPGSSEDVMPVDEVLDHYDQWRIRDHRLYEAGDSEAQAVLRSRTSWMVHELASHARFPRPEAKPSKLWKPGDVTDRPTGSDAPSKDELLHEYDQWQLRAEALAEGWQFEEMDELNAEMDHLVGAMYAWHRRAKAAGWS